MRWPVVAARRLLLRTDRTRARPLWRALHDLVIGCVGVYLRFGMPGSAFYARGSFAAGEPVFGISDVDVVLVVPGRPDSPGAERQRLRARWERLTRVAPVLGTLFADLSIYEDADLAAASSGSLLIYGLDRQSPQTRAAALFGETPVRDEIGLLTRPGLGGPACEWRLLAGPERRPRPGPWGASEQRIAAWQELQYWWRHMFALALVPHGPEAPLLAVKLVAETARIWLWLAFDERPASRRDVLAGALRRLPGEEQAIRLALALDRDLPRSPEVHAADVLPFVVRQSERIGGVLGAAVAGSPTPVGLVDTTGELSLVDWRALAVPEWPDETLVPVVGDPADPAVLAAGAEREAKRRWPVIRTTDLLVLPTRQIWERSALRAVQCRVTDPVSFAVLDGEATALFPGARGWSARDWALRAVAEHRAWLAMAKRPDWYLWAGPTPWNTRPTARGFGRLLTAVRAGLFLQSLDDGSPELLLGLEDVAERLPGTVGRDAIDAYREGSEDAHGPAYDALERAVRALPAYAGLPAR